MNRAKKGLSSILRSPLVKPLTIGAGFALGLVGANRFRKGERPELTGEVALITGGSRGLGLQLARQFARAGCKLAICARDAQELSAAQAELEAAGADVLAVLCDVAERTQVERMVATATSHYGRIDILVNNAGVIQVGPAQSMDLSDFETALGVMYWGILHTTWAVLPQMRARGSGRIVNITSIGGKVSVPHLLPYASAKFAAVGLSEGLRAELAGEGIAVTTIVPGLMRTGSHLNALFKGQHAGEFTWFSLGASLPFISMDAGRAAQQIVEATRRATAVRTLSLPAILLERFHGLFPGLTTEILGLVNRFVLPAAPAAASGRDIRRGMDVQADLAPARARLQRLLTTLGRRAARELHQFVGAESGELPETKPSPEQKVENSAKQVSPK